MGDDKARFLSSKEVPGFDALSGGFAHDGWSPFGTTGGTSDAAKWAVQRESLLSAVPILDLTATPVSRSSFALNLEGFDEKIPFLPSFENHNNSPNGSNHRRRSSLSSLSDLKKRESVATFLSSGDTSFDQALDAWFQNKKNPQEKNTKKKEDPHSDLEADLFQLEEVPRKRRPDDRPPEKRRPDDRAPEKTPEKTTTFRRNNTSSKKGGMRRTQTSDGMTRPANANKKSKRRQSVGGGGLMKDESDRTAANNRFLASKALMKDESATKSSTRRSREDRHKEDTTNSINNRSNKSLGALLMKDESMSGSARTQESRNRKASKSPSRGRTKRTENRKERSSASAQSALQKSSSSGLFSAASAGSTLTSYTNANIKWHKSSGSLETKGVVAPFRRTASLEETAAVNKDRPVAKAIANIISSTELPELQLHRSESEMENSSARTHESSRTVDSSTSRSRSPKPPKNQSSRSPSRGASGRSKGKSSRDRSRSSSSQSRRKNKAATAAADTSLLGGTGSTHSEREDMDALFDEIKTHKKKPTTRSGRRKVDKKLSESAREGGSSRRNHKGDNEGKKKEKGLRRVKSLDFNGPADMMRDKSSASHRSGRSEDKVTRRGRRTGSVEARGRSAEQEPEHKVRGSSEAPKIRRTGSVEAPRRRRGPSQEPRGRRAPSVDAHQSRRAPSQEPRGRRAPSVDAQSRRAPSQEPRGRRAPSVDAQSRRAPSQEPRGRRAPSVDAQIRLRDKQLTQSVAAIPEPSFGRSKAQPDTAESNESGEEESGAAPPVNLPSISGLAGGEVPTWKMQGNKSKTQPRDQDDKANKKDKDANKGRRFTQMVWKSRIKEAKSR